MYMYMCHYRYVRVCVWNARKGKLTSSADKKGGSPNVYCERGGREERRGDRERRETKVKEK
jgi:hypothetical protein